MRIRSGRAWPVTVALLRLLRWYVRYTPGSLAKPFLVKRLLNEGFRRSPYTGLATTWTSSHLRVTTSDLIQRYVYLFGVWEPNLSHWIYARLQQADVFIDIGAHIGYFSVLASDRVGEAGRVVAVEASPDIYALLLENLRINHCSNVRAVNAAVFDRAIRSVFYLKHAGNLGATTLVRPQGEVESTFETITSTLGKLLTQEEITQARLIKIDVEGAEAAVVRSLAPLLESMRPDVEVVVEVSPERLAHLGQSVDDITKPLTSRGFHAYRLENDYRAESYSVWRRPAAPIRWHGRITEQSDIVFSRVNENHLAE